MLDKTSSKVKKLAKINKLLVENIKEYISLFIQLELLVFI